MPGVDLQVVADALLVARRRGLHGACAAPGVEMVGVSRQSNRPSRSLTLERAEDEDLGARRRRARSAAPSSMSAHASRSRAGVLRARAPPRPRRGRSAFALTTAITPGGAPGRSLARSLDDAR